MDERKKRVLDIEKVEAALKRAAHRALHGTREERSGRFLHRDKLAFQMERDSLEASRKKSQREGF